MRWVSFAVILIIFAIVSAGNFLNFIAIGQMNIKPEILIVLLIFFASNISLQDAILASFIIGFMTDISGTTVGPAILSLGIIGSGFSLIKNTLLLNRMRYQTLTVFIFSLLALCFIELLTLYKTGQNSPKPVLTVIATSAYTAIIAPFIWKMLDSISLMFGIKKPRKRR